MQSRNILQHYTNWAAEASKHFSKAQLKVFWLTLPNSNSKKLYIPPATAKEIVTRWQPCIVLKGHVDRVDTIAFKPDNPNILASGSWDESIRLWNLNDPEKQPIVLTGNAYAVTALAFKSDNSNILASGFFWSTQYVRLWNLSNPEEQNLILADHTGDVRALAFKPDTPNILASGSSDGTIRVWDLNDPEEQHTVLEGHTDAINTIVFKPDNPNILASCSRDKTIRLWNLNDPEGHTIFSGNHDIAYAIAFKPDNSNILAASSYWNGGMRLWDLNDPEKQPTVLAGHTDGINAIVFKPDNPNILASCSSDKTIRLWDISNLDNWSEESYTLKNYFEQPLRKEKLQEKSRVSLLLIGLDHLRNQYPDDSQYKNALKKKIDPQAVENTLSSIPENVRNAFIDKYKLDTSFNQ